MSENRTWLDATPPKTAFTFGIVLGVAVMSILALGGVVTMMARGGGVNLAFGKDGGNVAPAPAYVPTAGDVVPTGPVDVPVTDQDHIRGSKDAKVTLVEFSDFECPFCGRFKPTVDQVLRDYGDKIRLVYKHFPLDSIHPFARPAAEASECAAEQGKFWEYHDGLFTNQDKLSNEYFGQLAGELNLDTTKFTNCLTTGKYRQRVEDDYQMGLAAGVQGTPHTLVNGIAISGAESLAVVKARIDAALAE